VSVVNGVAVASLWKNPWLRRQRIRLRRPFQILVAPIVINYIKLVVKTSTIVADPPDYVARGRQNHPSIIALWHGQFFLLPAIYPREVPGRAIVAKHDDAEALRRILKHFGLGLVRGAGAAGRKRDRGGAEAAHGLIASLREGFSIALTGDIPPGPARKCGVGIVLISSRSGRPILPFAVATSRYASVNSWSRMTINLPFSRLGIAMGEPIHVPTDAGPAVLETYRQKVEAALNEVTAKAYRLAGADMTRATPLPRPPRSSPSG
jgi:3-deoxy-D-manno-octulosonic-acid transferase